MPSRRSRARVKSSTDTEAGWSPFLKSTNQVAERHVVAELVGPRIRTVAVAAPRIGTAGPEADLVQGKTFTVGGAENHRAHAAVADGIAFRFPYGRRASCICPSCRQGFCPPVDRRPRQACRSRSGWRRKACPERSSQAIPHLRIKRRKEGIEDALL